MGDYNSGSSLYNKLSSSSKANLSLSNKSSKNFVNDNSSLNNKNHILKRYLNSDMPSMEELLGKDGIENDGETNAQSDMEMNDNKHESFIKINEKGRKVINVNDENESSGNIVVGEEIIEYQTPNVNRFNNSFSDTPTSLPFQTQVALIGQTDYSLSLKTPTPLKRRRPLPNTPDNNTALISPLHSSSYSSPISPLNVSSFLSSFLPTPSPNRYFSYQSKFSSSSISSKIMVKQPLPSAVR
jgi:hypothetical protein